MVNSQESIRVLRMNLQRLFPMRDLNYANKGKIPNIQINRSTA